MADTLELFLSYSRADESAVTALREQLRRRGIESFLDRPKLRPGQACGAELLALRGHEGAVLAAGYSPDGARIVSGSDDATVRVWFVGEDDAALVEHACASLPRDLSVAAIERFNLDPEADWPCAERARALWPHEVAEVEPAAGPEAE